MSKFNFIKTDIPDVQIIEPTVFGDDRGYFMETYQIDEFAAAGIDKPFVQDNQSRSTKGVLRGLHFQTKHTQGKLVRVTLGEAFGMPIVTNVTGKMVTALRRLGFDAVYDTDFAADVVIMEEGTELLDRIRNGGALPMFTSCCPGWINYAEKHCPDILPRLSSTRSPQAVFGALAKTYLPEKMGMAPQRIRVISIMPCIAKKDEAARAELASGGIPDVDVVITVREFARLLRRMGVDLASIEPEPFDNPFMSASTGAAVIFGSTGGVMEAAVRTVYAVLNGKEMESIESAPLRGMDGVREADIDLGPGNGSIRVAICHGLRNARRLAEEALAGTSPYTFIEVMACPGGCVDGGGTSRVKGDYHPCAVKRQQGLYAIAAPPVAQ